MYKADSTKTYDSDASITVTPNPLASMFTGDATNYGTMTLNANNIFLGNVNSTVNIPGTLNIAYTTGDGSTSYNSLGQFLSQLSRTRAG